ncbi:MAG: histidine triad nucleotide-binding protein [Gammaproteobacteria bacterium]|nr:MAG: histidine triad nucleotide-binding protein [Gammaproteobacteria bacterium]
MSDTLFSKIIKREIPADIVYEDEQCLAFRDINPQAPVHLLIIPKKAIATINDIEESDREIIGQLFIATKRIAKDQGFDKEGYRVVINCNDDGGQDVYHIHLHLLAGKPLGWPPYRER